MRRRALLASGGALLGSALAGCLGESDDADASTATNSVSTQATADSAPTDEPSTPTEFDVSLALTLERHQPNVAVLAVDSVGLRPAGYQYLFYHVAVTDGDPPERTDFGFRYGGQVYGPGVQTAGTLWRATESDDRYTASRGEGWLVFELPAARPATHAAFALGSEEWPVSGVVRERLSQPAPPLTVDWGLADDQPADGARLAFSVTNESDVDTRFVAGLNGLNLAGAQTPVTAFNREVPAGETVSWTFTHEGVGPFVASSEENSDARYRLAWTQGEEVLYVAPE